MAAQWEKVPLASQAERSPWGKSTEALQSCFCLPGLPSMTIERRKSCPAFLTKWRGEVRVGHESRDTKHGLYGRSVRRGCERLAQRITAARTAAPAIKSMIPSSLLPTIARYCPASFFPEQISAHRPPFSVGPTSSAVSWEIPELCAESRVCGRPPKQPMLRKGNVLYCTNRGTFYVALTIARLELPLRSGHDQEQSGAKPHATWLDRQPGAGRMPSGQGTISKRR